MATAPVGGYGMTSLRSLPDIEPSPELWQEIVASRAMGTPAEPHAAPMPPSVAGA
jgi:hypothetical protein